MTNHVYLGPRAAGRVSELVARHPGLDVALDQDGAGTYVSFRAGDQLGPIAVYLIDRSAAVLVEDTDGQWVVEAVAS